MEKKTGTVKPVEERHRFGTFGGVFTPAILTILGVILFMRANFVVGQAGVIGAVIILCVAKSITFTTSLSIGAISTNMRMRGGGPYYLISRVLGAEYGGAIGIALFFALSLSVPFYILGFTEALIRNYPQLAPHFQKITLTTAALLFMVAWFGARWAIRTQFIIMGFLFLSIFIFMAGTATHFSFALLKQNLAPAYTSMGDFLNDDGSTYSFWVIFAIYFPAVTGIDAGLNMSGDLKDPSRSIPLGTICAVSVGFMVYLVQIILSGGANPRAELIAHPFNLLRDNALFGWTALVSIGVFAATLSSVLGSYLGGPRVLQAVSRDRLLSFMSFFSRGTATADEPRRALCLTLTISVLVLLWAGNESGGDSLNAMAAVISMFFLYSYGMINLAAFLEDFTDNPSFRPTFRFFHWSISLAGAAGCLAVSMLINWIAALIAVVIIFLLMLHIKTRRLQSTFGDARRGFFYSAVRKNLLRLRLYPDDPKNWRPTVLVFSGQPTDRGELIAYSVWLEAKRGLVYFAYILRGTFEELASRREAAFRQMTNFCIDKYLDAFPVVVIAKTIREGVSMLLQSTVIGPIRPNLAVFGWSGKVERNKEYIDELRTAADLGLSIALLKADSLPEISDHKRVDLWWRGKKNGGLMLLLAYLLSSNWQWEDAEIRLLRVVENEEGREPAREALQYLTDAARVKAAVSVVVSSEPFEDILAEHSGDAACVFLGFELPEEGEEEKWYAGYYKLVDRVPSVILVNSRGGEGLLA